MYFGQGKKTISALGYCAQKAIIQNWMRIKILPQWTEAKKYVITKPPLQNILKGVLNREDENNHRHESIPCQSSREDQKVVIE
jgi:hypothetical protein